MPVGVSIVNNLPSPY